MYIFRLIVIAALALSVSGCLYSDIKLPLDIDVADTTLGSKVGTSANESVLWLVAWGDGGTEAAARDGNITTIRHMDVQREMILFGVYSKRTTIVYGD